MKVRSGLRMAEVVFTRNLIDHYELRLKSVSGAGEEQILVKTLET